MQHVYAGTALQRSILSLWAWQVIHGVIGVMGVLLVYVPISVATGPAEVSTECEKFFDELNNVRLLTLSPAIHARVGILEPALSKMNRGQVRASRYSSFLLAELFRLNCST